MNNYWSKKEFDKRIKWYDEDIKKVRRVIKIHHANKSYKDRNRYLLKSLIASKKLHKMAYKNQKRG